MFGLNQAFTCRRCYLKNGRFSEGKQLRQKEEPGFAGVCGFLGFPNVSMRKKHVEDMGLYWFISVYLGLFQVWENFQPCFQLMLFPERGFKVLEFNHGLRMACSVAGRRCGGRPQRSIEHESPGRGPGRSDIEAIKVKVLQVLFGIARVILGMFRFFVESTRTGDFWSWFLEKNRCVD